MMNTQTMNIKGLTCEACTKLTAKRVRSIEGVETAEVDLASGIATIRADRELSVDEVNRVFEGTHYRAEKNDD